MVGEEPARYADSVSGDGRDFGVARLIYEMSVIPDALGYMGTFVGGPVYDATVHSGRTFHIGIWKTNSRRANIMTDQKRRVRWRFRSYVQRCTEFKPQIEIDYMDENINFNDLGFLRRNDYGSFRYMLLYNKQRISPQVSNFRMTLTAFQEYNTTKSQVTDSALLWRTSGFCLAEIR